MGSSYVFGFRSIFSSKTLPRWGSQGKQFSSQNSLLTMSSFLYALLLYYKVFKIRFLRRWMLFLMLLLVS